MDAPTAIKNKPSKTPLNGSISLSNSWRNSELARTTPARNVPRAGLNPAIVMRSAVAITIKSAAAVKSSLRRILATNLRKGTIKKRPPKITTTTEPSRVNVCLHPGSPPINVALLSE